MFRSIVRHRSVIISIETRPDILSAHSFTYSWDKIPGVAMKLGWLVRLEGRVWSMVAFLLLQPHLFPLHCNHPQLYSGPKLFLKSSLVFTIEEISILKRRLYVLMRIMALN